MNGKERSIIKMDKLFDILLCKCTLDNRGNGSSWVDVRGNGRPWVDVMGNGRPWVDMRVMGCCEGQWESVGGCEE